MKLMFVHINSFIDIFKLIISMHMDRCLVMSMQQIIFSVDASGGGDDNTGVIIGVVIGVIVAISL